MDTETILKERVQRVRDAVSLKEPDRVPITPFTDIFFAPLQVGMTHKQAMYKGRKYAKAALEVYSRYDWDLYPTLLFPGMGKLMDGLGATAIKWPGAANPEFCLEDDKPYQYIEKPWMEAEEYEDLLKDPTGFLIRKIVPAQNTSLELLKSFPQMSDLSMMFKNNDGILGHIVSLGTIIFFIGFVNFICFVMGKTYLTIIKMVVNN